MGVDNILSMIDLVRSLPPTSIANERAFNHLKLIKSDRRHRLKEATLNDLMLVKLESSPVLTFDPTHSNQQVDGKLSY